MSEPEREGDPAPAEAEDPSLDEPVDPKRAARLSELDSKIRRRDRQIRVREGKANGIGSKARPAAPVEGGNAPLPEGLEGRLAITENQVEFLIEAFAEGLEEMQLTADELRGELEPIREEQGGQEAAVDKIDDRLRRLEARLSDSTRDLEQRLQAGIERLNERIDTLDSTPREGARRGSAPDAGPKKQAAASSRKPKSAQRRRKASSADAIALNEATFEQLRELGLSGAQSLRILSSREARGGFSSVDDLDTVVPGLPDELQGELKRRLVVPSGES